MKGPDARGPEQKEENMKLISNHELHQRSESELSALFRTVSEGLVRTRRRIVRAQERSRLAGKYQPGARSSHEHMPAVKRRDAAVRAAPLPIRACLPRIGCLKNQR